MISPNQHLGPSPNLVHLAHDRRLHFPRHNRGKVMGVDGKRRVKSPADWCLFLVQYGFFILIQHSDSTKFNPQPKFDFLEPERIKSGGSGRSDDSYVYFGYMPLS